MPKLRWRTFFRSSWIGWKSNRWRETFAEDVQIDTPVRMRPTRLGRTSFTMMIGAGPQESSALWSQLPPLDGANKLEYKQGAKVLAASENDQPLLISQNFGDGRVMAFAGDSTWRWWMRGYEAAHKRFWRQVILWLAKKDEANEGNVWIKLAQRRFAPGQRVEFTMGAQSPGGEAIKDAAYQVEVESPGGARQSVSAVHGTEQVSASFRDTQTPGDYIIHVTASQAGKEIGVARARFLVFEQDLELDNASADTTVLESLTAMTGGKALAPEELPALLRKLAEDTASLEVEVEAKESPWDTWPFFLVLIALMGARNGICGKKWGLV